MSDGNKMALCGDVSHLDPTDGSLGGGGVWLWGEGGGGMCVSGRGGGHNVRASKRGIQGSKLQPNKENYALRIVTG